MQCFLGKWRCWVRGVDGEAAGVWTDSRGVEGFLEGEVGDEEGRLLICVSHDSVTTRSAIEEEYGKRLTKLAKTGLGKDEIG